MKALWLRILIATGVIANLLELSGGILSGLVGKIPSPWVLWLDTHMAFILIGVFVLVGLVALFRKLWPTPFGRTIRWYSPDKGQGLPS